MQKNQGINDQNLLRQEQIKTRNLEEGVDIIEQNLELQGQKKITETTFLQFSIIKIVVLGVPLILSIIGLYFILKYRRFRLAIFYNSLLQFQKDRATHVHIKLNDRTHEICRVSKQQYKGEIHYVFVCQLLKYQIIDGHVCPVGSKQIDRLEFYLKSSDRLSAGLSSDEYVQRVNFYGRNTHDVEIPGYIYYICVIMTQPLFVLQYFIFGVWIIQQLYINVLANFAFCFAVTTVNYIILYYNFNKVKHIAERVFSIKVLRMGTFIEVNNSQIVPGDIFIVEKQIPCDSILISGDLMVNQVNFTGENLPILKYKIQNTKQINNSAHWIYEGSEILSVKTMTLAMAAHTGYTSHRGRIIRKIIKHNVQEPAFTHNILLFFIFAFVIAAIVYFSYIVELMKLPIREDTIVFLFFQIVSLAVPVGYIGVLNLYPGMSLIRLDMKQIYGKQPYKIYESAQIKTICFDKTGTLTNNSVEMADIYSCNQQGYSKITDFFQKLPVVRYIFATCLMIKKVQNQDLKGDEIDLRMFQKSRAKLNETNQQGVLWQIASQGQIFQVLRVNQFESKHRSMSVLVRQKSTMESFVFVKGSPELINRSSKNKCKLMFDLVKQLSFQGYRTIGFGFKRLTENQWVQYMSVDRQKFLEGIQMVGVASFINKLKQQTVGVIDRLKKEVCVDIKMITGDNIYTAVQTGYKAGIIAKQKKVVVCQGRNIIDKNTMKVKVIVISQQNGYFHQYPQIVQSFNQYLHQAPVYTLFAIQGELLNKDLYEREDFNRISIFARVSPENKTEIIKGIKLHLQKEYDEKSTYQKLFGRFRTNVCMVGDGANDLMAIKEADVGIGLSESDGTFSADFVVANLNQIEQIIREGKSISRSAMQTLLMYFINTWLYIPLMLLMVHDLCSFSESTLLYKSLAFVVFVPIMFGLTKSSEKNTHLIPEMNILSKQHQINIWVNTLIFSLAFVLSFCYYWGSDERQYINRGWVSMKDNFTTYSKTTTLCFKLILGHCISINFNIYQNEPWKESMNKNVFLSFWTLINVVVAYCMFFHQKYFSFMNLPLLGQSVSFVVLIFMVIAFVLSYVFTYFLSMYFFKMQIQENDDKNSQINQSL